MFRSTAFLLMVLALTLGVSVPVLAARAPKPAAAPQQNYQYAFRLIDSGHVEQAAVFAAHGRDPVLNKVIRAVYMAHPGNDVGFNEMAAFIAQNPDWPGMKGILSIAEQKIPQSASPTQVIAWFQAHPPVSLAGFYRCVDALEATGQTQNLEAMVRIRWIDGDFNGDELAAFTSRFGNILGSNAHNARLDRVLWKDDLNGARRLYPYVDSNHRALAEARLALAHQNSNAAALAEDVPGSLQDDPGFLYEKLRWFRRNNRDEQANDILRHAPDELDKQEAWWEERQIMARRAIEKHDFDLAYRLTVDHGQNDPKTLIQAEFLAGWLALRFLNRPDEALEHFRRLYNNATTPISRSRGAYWMGRSYEMLSDKGDAEQAYEDAAALSITYYGQLAIARLQKDPVIHALPEPTIPPHIRNVFFDKDNIRAVEHLHDIGQTDRAHIFFKAAADGATQRADFALLMELAYQIRRPDYAIEAAKAANQKNMLMASGGFPVLDRVLPRPPEPAFTHALIRQESMFNPKAGSPVGAQGLMQLMPRTAKAVARMCGLKYRQKSLCEPDYNLRLGTTFIQQQLNMFNGSYVLALAAYNAGPGRVHEWMGQIGDPRDPNIDPIDWIELIPIYETRNYVQRILESLQVYRARLSGGQAPLKIVEDLRR